MNPITYESKNIVVLETVKKSIHSGLTVKFYFLNHENCQIFLDIIKKAAPLLEWQIHEEYLPYGGTIRADAERDPVAFANTFSRWAGYFETENYYDDYEY